MRKRLTLFGTLLILSGVGIWWATFARLTWWLGLQLDVPTMLAWHQLPDLESLQAEFGPGLHLVPTGD